MFEDEGKRRGDVQLFALEQVQTKLSNLRYGLEDVAGRETVDPQSRSDLRKIALGLQSVIDAALEELRTLSDDPNVASPLNSSGLRAAIRKISEDIPQPPRHPESTRVKAAGARPTPVKRSDV